MNPYPCTKCPVSVRNSIAQFPHPKTPKTLTSRKQQNYYPCTKAKSFIYQIPLSSSPSFWYQIKAADVYKCVAETRTNNSCISEDSFPTMSEIMEAARSQNIDLQLKIVGPYFKVTADSLKTKRELVEAMGMVRVWFQGKILHLHTIRFREKTLGMEKSIFGLGLFIGAVAIRHGYDSGCKKAELLAIKDSELYHSKRVRLYTRIGFKPVHQVTDESFFDLAMWGGVGTLMDADIQDLLVKWCTRFKPKS